MFPCDDDSPGHVDRFDCPLINPQARRMHRHNQEGLSAGDRATVGASGSSSLRLQAGRTTPNGLNDRIAIPKKRTPLAQGPYEMTTWQ